MRRWCWVVLSLALAACTSFTSDAPVAGEDAGARDAAAEGGSGDAGGPDAPDAPERRYCDAHPATAGVGFCEDFEGSLRVADAWDDQTALTSAGARVALDGPSAERTGRYAEMRMGAAVAGSAPQSNFALLNKTLPRGTNTTVAASFLLRLPTVVLNGTGQTLRYFAIKAVSNGGNGGVGLFQRSGEGWFVQVFGVGAPKDDFVKQVEPPPLDTWVRVVFTVVFSATGGSVSLTFGTQTVLLTPMMPTLGPGNTASSLIFNVGPRQEAGDVPDTRLLLDDLSFGLR